MEVCIFPVISWGLYPSKRGFPGCGAAPGQVPDGRTRVCPSTEEKQSILRGQGHRDCPGPQGARSGIPSAAALPSPPAFGAPGLHTTASPLRLPLLLAQLFIQREAALGPLGLFPIEFLAGFSSGGQLEQPRRPEV